MSATSEFVRNLRVEVDERPAPTPVKKETQPVVKKERKDDDEEMQDAEEGEENENEEDDENQGDDVMDEPLVSGSLAAALQFLKQKGTNQPFEAYLVLQGISFY